MQEGLQEMRGTDPQVRTCWRAMAGEGMTIPLWGADVARPHPSRTCRLNSASALGDTKPHGCVLHLIVGAAGRYVGAVVAPGAGRCHGWVGKAGHSKAGPVLREEPNTSCLRDIPPGWPWGMTHCFYTVVVCETLFLFHTTTLAALSSETLRRGAETVQKVSFLFPDLIFA